MTRITRRIRSPRKGRNTMVQHVTPYGIVTDDVVEPKQLVPLQQPDGPNRTVPCGPPANTAADNPYRKASTAGLEGLSGITTYARSILAGSRRATQRAIHVRRPAMIVSTLVVLLACAFPVLSYAADC